MQIGMHDLQTTLGQPLFASLSAVCVLRDLSKLQLYCTAGAAWSGVQCLIVHLQNNVHDLQAKLSAVADQPDCKIWALVHSHMCLEQDAAATAQHSSVLLCPGHALYSCACIDSSAKHQAPS